jgi:hypothetical protein
MREITRDDLFKMELHDWKRDGDGMMVIRVVGGWIYTVAMYENGTCISASSCFVPDMNRKS